MEPLSFRPAWIEVDLAAIQANVKKLHAHLPHATQLFAVVKANGYGHGDVEVAKAALSAGASALAVALLEEAVRLRESGITAPILVLGWVAPEFASIAVKYDIMLTVFQKDWVKQVKVFNVQGIKIHVKLDTGMGRIGLRTEQEIKGFMDEIAEANIDVVGVYTHYATADEADNSYYQQQLERFHHLVKTIQARCLTPLVTHLSNSAASLRFPDERQDYVRFGIGMYGLYPSKHVQTVLPFKLKPALSLYSRIIHVKKIASGDKLSYGKTYTAVDEEWIATLPLGYADGIQRKWQGLDVIIDGKRMPIVGRVCMDQFMVKLDRYYPVGTQVTLVGKSGDQEITLEEIADHLETINYEVACLFGPRIPRYYINT